MTKEFCAIFICEKNHVNPVVGNLNLFSFCGIKKVRNKTYTMLQFTIILGIKTLQKTPETAGQGKNLSRKAAGREFWEMAFPTSLPPHEQNIQSLMNSTCCLLNQLTEPHSFKSELSSFSPSWEHRW